MAKISRRALAADADVGGISPYGDRVIPLGIRRAVEARDGMVCRRCGCDVVRLRDCETYKPDVMHLDHVIPWASGGPTTVDNLIVTCAGCNLGRGRPKSIIRQSVLNVETDGWDYWWPAGFAPPNPVAADTRGLLSPTVLARMLDKTPAQIIRMASKGRLEATAESPFLVMLPVALRSNTYRKRGPKTMRLLPGHALSPSRRHMLEQGESLRAKRRRRALDEKYDLFLSTHEETP